ncbi:hypothetical protein P167DRAFT_57006 [Morchella conica CCBAS932]|uniref:Uncharacterized protein n=1 Tax=Morchella conica CCBAS932 TaxID=1392247 RepID=A0A3N4KVK5_9PEZI|nr:hypothetical protein P167DRAFT_57006 [Morchella conica CCBAS932]
MTNITQRHVLAPDCRTGVNVDYCSLFSRYLFSRYLFSRYLFSRYLFSRYLFSRYLFSRYLFSTTGNIKSVPFGT